MRFMRATLLMAPVLRLLASVLLVAVVSSLAIGCDTPNGTTNVELAPANSRLLRIQVDGLWGYCDALGRVVIKPRFRWAQDFSYGFALVALDEKLQYIDRTGSVIIQPPFTHDHSPFVHGFAIGSIGLEFHYLGANGRLLAQAFAGAENFSEGLAAVCIDPTRFAKKPPAENDFNIPGKWGFIDASGELVIKAEFVAVKHFNDGLAPVYVGGRNVMCAGPVEGKWGFVNRQGKLVLKPQFEPAQSFSEGLAAVSLDGKSTGYINASGEFVIQPRPFAGAREFHDGVASIRGSHELVSPGWKDFGYVDKSGNIFVHPNFSEGMPFSEGLAATREKPVWDRVEGKWIQGPYGYVNKRGEWVIAPQFTHAGTFSEGIACVQNASSLGYIDRRGKFIWPPSK